VYFRLIFYDSFPKIEKTPCDTLSYEQADARREKAAREEPHLLPDVVSSTDKIISSYIKDAVINCSGFSFIA
jgi:hypothetical protein